MNGAQLHLMMNHIPVVGMIFTAAALAAGLLFRSGALVRSGFVLLVALSLAAVPVYFSGEPAEELVEDAAGVTHATIETHEDFAKIAMIGIVAIGLVALVALIRAGRREMPRGFAVVMLVAALAWSGVLAWTAHLGGQIRHPELTGQLPAGVPAEDRRGPGHD
jgi:hypothetical protein